MKHRSKQGRRDKRAYTHKVLVCIPGQVM
jgi:hypothetical protein